MTPTQAHRRPEHALMVTGIGGQGVQLLAKTLAQALTAQGRYAMLGAEYGGEMRGGPTQATVVVGDAPLRALPIVPRAEAAILMHDRYSENTLTRLSPGGLCLVNSSVAPGGFAADRDPVLVPATALAREAGVAQAGSFVMLGAYAALTGAATRDQLVAAMTGLLPPYRRQHADGNARAIDLGIDQVGAVAGSTPIPTGALS